MPDFKKNYAKGPRRPFTPAFKASAERYDAECTSCHARCQVPFRPNGKKPIYCSNCFTQNTGGEKPRFEKREFRNERHAAPAAPQRDPRIDDLKRQLDTIQQTLDELVTAIGVSNRSAAIEEAIRPYKKSTSKTAVAKKKRTKGAND